MTIVRIRRTPGGTDPYGSPIPGTAARCTIDGAFVAPRDSADLNDAGRAGVIVGLTLYAPYGTDIDHTDQIEVDGTVYEVDGETCDWLQPMTGWQAGTVVALRRAAG